MFEAPARPGRGCEAGVATEARGALGHTGGYCQLADRESIVAALAFLVRSISLATSPRVNNRGS
jgi:hypothetical protein